MGCGCRNTKKPKPVKKPKTTDDNPIVKKIVKLFGL